MDQTAIQQNEQALGELLDRGDKAFVSQIGIMALALLTEQMQPEQYRELLSNAIDNASELQKHKQLGTLQPAKEK